MDRVTTVLEKRKSQLPSKTWTALAKELGVSKQYLSNVYQGHKKPSRKLLNSLGLRIEEKVVRA